MFLRHLFENKRTAPILLEASIDFLRGKYLPLLAAAITKQAVKIPEPLAALIGATADETASKVFDYVVTCDPDPQKKSLQWLLTRLLDDGFMLEDGAKAFETLKAFAEVKAQLPAGSRDLNRMKALGDLYTLVEPFEGMAPAPSQRQVKRGVEQQMRQQAKIVLNTAEYKVLIPLTREASCHYGVNTRWCTAATGSHNYFDHYNRSGPLFIILEKRTNTRWQFQPATNSYMDEKDRPINLGAFLEQHPQIGKLFDDLDGTARTSVDTPRGKLLVFSDGDEGYQLKSAPGLQAPVALRIRVKDGLLGLISNRQGGPDLSVMPMNTMADLLDNLGIKGDPTAMATESTYGLYFRDDFWGSLYEHAKPFLQMAGGWHWSELVCEHADVGGHTLLVLVSPQPVKNPGAGTVTGAEHAYAVAAYYDAGDEFSVNEVLGSSRLDKTRKVVMETLSPRVLALLLHETGLRKWLADSVIESSDLTQEDCATLLEQRPELCNVGTVFKVQGLTDLVKEKITEAFKEAELDAPEGWAGDSLLVRKWRNIEDCVDDIGDDHAKWLASLSKGENRIDMDYGSATEDDIRTLLRDLPKNQQKALANWVVAECDDEIEAYKEDNDEDDFDATSVYQLAALVAEQNISEIMDAANNAMATGQEAGAEDEAMKNFRSAIKDAPLLFADAAGNWTDGLNWDVPVALAVPGRRIVEVIDANELDDVSYNGWAEFLEIKVEAREPHYGYSNYDKEAANERFQAELPV